MKQFVTTTVEGLRTLIASALLRCLPGELVCRGPRHRGPVDLDGVVQRARRHKGPVVVGTTF